MINGDNMIYDSFGCEETYEIARKIGQVSKPGQVYVLSGDLGVGKTVFSQGFAKGLGIEEPVSSPTFTIIKEYDGGRLPFYHFDVYRISDASEMDDIGFEDYFYGDGVCLVEWGNLFEEIMPEDAIYITIEKDLEKGFDYRRIYLSRRRPLPLNQV